MFSWLSGTVVRQNGSLLVCKCWSRRRVYSTPTGSPGCSRSRLEPSPTRPPHHSRPRRPRSRRPGLASPCSPVARLQWSRVSNQDIPSYVRVLILTSRDCRYYRNDERATALSTVCCHHISSARPRGTHNFRWVMERRYFSKNTSWAMRLPSGVKTFLFLYL